MKRISTVIFALLCASFCSGNPLIAKSSWEFTATFSAPADDKKLSMIHQKLSDISAYENVKETVCPDNQAKWGFSKHLETGKIIVVNNAKILPWNEAVAHANTLFVGDKMRPSARSVHQLNWPHAEMKPFVRCLNHCFDLSEMLSSAVRNEANFLIKSLIDADIVVNDEVIEPLPRHWKFAIAWKIPQSVFLFIAQNTKTFILLGFLILEQVFKFGIPLFVSIMGFIAFGEWKLMELSTEQISNFSTTLPLMSLIISDFQDPPKFYIHQHVYRGISYWFLLCALNVPMSLVFVVFIKWLQFFRYNQPMAQNQFLFLVSLSILFAFFPFDWDRPEWIKPELVEKMFKLFLQ